MPAALHVYPLVNERTGIGASNSGIGGTQVAQPDKTEQRSSPFVRRRRHFKRRSAIADDYLAGEGKASGIDFTCAGGIGGSQILRCNKQPVGLGWGKAPPKQWKRIYAADKA